MPGQIRGVEIEIMADEASLPDRPQQRPVDQEALVATDVFQRRTHPVVEPEDLVLPVEVESLRLIENAVRREHPPVREPCAQLDQGALPWLTGR